MAAPRSSRTLVDGGKDRLQPALLDRLTDDAPLASQERAETVYVTESRLRAALLRDLGWLLNANSASGVIDFDGLPHAERSVLNYGVPPMSGQLLSELDWSALESGIRRAIIAFEPRILAETLQVTLVPGSSSLSSHNTLQFEIRCQFWSMPYPIEMLLKSSLDLESGQVAVQPA
ncbi:MAG: type VI secretion protein [Rubrivivax sp. SCN 71-131]|jgi:type VI secretion system protein ImpF|nr:MAG: type VI secretion protein [Rubrivivax sp. SCN 71-131]